MWLYFEEHLSNTLTNRLDVANQLDIYAKAEGEIEFE